MLTKDFNYKLTKTILITVLILALVFATVNTAYATIFSVINTNDLVITDWATVSDAYSQSDASGDVSPPELDIVKGWAVRGLNQYSNPAEDQLIFRIQTSATLGQYDAVGAALDCNNNGSYTDSADRIVVHMNDCPAATGVDEKNLLMHGDQSSYQAIGPDIGEGIGVDNEVGVLVTDLPNPCGAPNGDVMIKFLTADAELACVPPYTGSAIEVDQTSPGSPMSGLNVPTIVDSVEVKVNLNSNPLDITYIALIIAGLGILGLIGIAVLKRRQLRDQ